MPAGKVVYVELIAQVRKFNSGMKKAESGLARVRKAAGLAGAAIAAIGAVAVRELTREFDALTDEMDKLGKTAKKLEFPVDAVESLGFAIEESGGNAASLTKAGLQMQFALGNAAKGLETYTFALEKIGLTYEDLQGLDPVEQFLTLRQALSEANSENRAFAAQTLLGGRAMKDMAVFLQLSSEEMNTLVERAQALGNATERQTKLGEDLNDRQEEINKAFRSLKLDVWERFAEILLPLKERAVEFFETMSDETRNNIIKGIIVAIGVLLGTIALALVAVVAAAAPFLAVGAKILAFAIALGGIFFNIGLGIYTVITNIEELGRSFEWLKERITDALSGFGGKVLGFLGFGGDDSMAQAAAAPAPRGGGAGTTNNVGPTTNNYFVEGNHTLEKELRRKGDASRRGKGR